MTREGNLTAQKLLAEVFEISDRQWRGIGLIPASGYRLRPAYAAFDAEQRFGVAGVTAQESPLCIAGQILQGLKKPHECSAFGTLCRPEHPSARRWCRARARARRITAMVERRS